MTRIDELLRRGPTVSFEFFPPKGQRGDARLRKTFAALTPLQPSFVSVTYGAGGGTRERTFAWVVEILERTTVPPMSHLTSVCQTRDELAEYLARLRDAGVENVLVMRGDEPRDVDEPFWELEHGVELVALAREVGGAHFSVGVAAHPEGHPLSPDLPTDRHFLAEKLSAADFGVTQFFFRFEDYASMVDDLRARGCDTPVIPGLIAITNARQIAEFAALSGAALPSWLRQCLRAAGDDPREVRRVGVDVATTLGQRLLEAGAPGLHLFTLNRASEARQIVTNLGLDPRGVGRGPGAVGTAVRHR